MKPAAGCCSLLGADTACSRLLEPATPCYCLWQAATTCGKLLQEIRTCFGQAVFKIQTLARKLGFLQLQTQCKTCFKNTRRPKSQTVKTAKAALRGKNTKLPDH